jgi:hypothetical protein
MMAAAGENQRRLSEIEGPDRVQSIVVASALLTTELSLANALRADCIGQ